MRREGVGAFIINFNNFSLIFIWWKEVVDFYKFLYGNIGTMIYVFILMFIYNK